jgi:isocitrate dehydrogenase kinase/phosphatase
MLYIIIKYMYLEKIRMTYSFEIEGEYYLNLLCRLFKRRRIVVV